MARDPTPELTIPATIAVSDDTVSHRREQEKREALIATEGVAAFGNGRHGVTFGERGNSHSGI